MVPSRLEDDLETLTIVELRLDDIVSLVLTKEPIDDVKFERSRVVEEFDTDMVAEYDGEDAVWFGKTPILSDLMMSAA